MRFYNHDPLINKSFPSEPHHHEVLVQLLGDVAVRPRGQPHYLLEVGPQQSVSRPRETHHDRRVLVYRFVLVQVQELQGRLAACFDLGRVEFLEQSCLQVLEGHYWEHRPVHF